MLQGNRELPCPPDKPVWRVVYSEVPIEQTAEWLARRLPPNEREELLEDLAAVRWRLWNGQTDKAIDLIGRLFHDLKADEQGNSAIIALRGCLFNLRAEIEQNGGSIANCGARYLEGIERGANLLLQVRVALANDDLSEHLACQPPLQRRQTIISPFVPLPLFQRAA
jgi:hypothetical protein